MGKRVAVYLRVSTARQAEKDLSIPDQRRQLQAYCASKGWVVVSEYVEPGASATDDKRPAFQRMVDEATGPMRPFDVILVHSFSRFFRDAYLFEFYRRRLDKADVAVVSVTQELGDDPMADMLRRMLNLFDEYQSRENAKHVLRSMKENARQGYWNGSQPPYGYRTFVADTRGDAVKKKLAIDPAEADIVRLVFERYLAGNGVRAIAEQLNAKGLRYRRRRRFNSSLVHQILTRTAYRGLHHFNKICCKTRAAKDRAEWVAFETPVIIDPEIFERVQGQLAERRPCNTPPRVVNGPTLLTGIVKCGGCGGGMTLRTGKGGRYRYYTCNTRVTEGRSACAGRNIRMEQLDGLILEQLQQRLFVPDRLEELLAKLIERNQNRLDELQVEERALRTELRQTEEKINRLYEALAEGTVTNTDGFQRTLSRYEQRREDLLRRVSALGRQRDIPKAVLTRGNLERFAAVARAKLHEQDGAFRKAYLRLFVNRVEVADDEIRILGPKAALAHAALEATKPDHQPVPSFVRDWWAVKDSNLGPAD